MKRTAYRIYIALRSVLVTALAIIAVLYCVLYVVLSVPSAQERIRREVENAASDFLGVKVSIGKVAFDPFNEVTLTDVHVPDKEGRTLADIERLGAGISLYQLAVHEKVVITYAELVGLHAHIVRADKHSPTNLQFIIDALKPKDKNKPPTKFDVKLEAVVIRKSSATYNVLSEPLRADARQFDANHIDVEELSSDIRIPQLSNNRYEIELRRLMVKEKSGFTLSDMTANVVVTQRSISLSNFKIELPNSILVPRDMEVNFRDLKTLDKELRSLPFSLQMANSYLTLSDLRCFIPAFKNFRIPLYITTSVTGTADRVDIATLDIASENGSLQVHTAGTVFNLSNLPQARVELPTIKVNADLKTLAGKLPGGMLPAKAASLIARAGHLAINGSVKADAVRTSYVGTVNTGLGNIYANGTCSYKESELSYKGHLRAVDLQLAALAGKNGVLGNTSFDIDMDMAKRGKVLRGSVDGDIGYIDVKGYRYKDISANVLLDGNTMSGNLALNDPNAFVDISGKVVSDGANSRVDVDAELSGVNLYNLNLTKAHPHHSLSAGIYLEFTGNTLDNVEGDVIVSNVKYLNADNEGVTLDHFDVTARQKEGRKYLTLNSDLANGYVDGAVNFANLVPTLKRICSTAFPVLAEGGQPTVSRSFAATRSKHPAGLNNFTYNVRLAESSKLTDFFRLPVKIVHPINISGHVNESKQELSAGIDAPYIMQGNKVIEKTTLSLNVDGKNDLFTVNTVTQLDNKKGDILLVFNGNASDGRLNTDFNWRYDRAKDFSGTLSLTSQLGRNEETGKLTADIDVNPTHFVVNDTTWNIEPAHIAVDGKRIKVDDVNVNRENQFIKADGYVSSSMDDELNLQLKQVDLGYIFETLNINHVLFRGSATGDFVAAGAFSGNPKLNTDNLHVKRFAYQNAVLGDADLKSSWDNEDKGILISAAIHQYNGRESFVHGGVYLAKDSLNFKFNADRLNVEVVEPFMSAFSSDVSGEATGEAELYGTFKLINMRGKLFANPFKMKLDYTNTYYTVSDTVVLEPGLIRLRDVTVKDPYGNTGKLNGTVTHHYFKNASFDFAMTDVHNMLCFNTTDKDNPIWYGKVFANGAAYIKGHPGLVNIDINMSAAPNSSFTFVVSDREEAGEYTFVKFTDKRKEEQERRNAEKVPDFLKKLEASQEQQSDPSVFNLNMQLDANPNVALNLIMDPEGGDRIKATGNGNMRISYSSNDDMKMFGTYTVDEGHYNFTLQDIIVRDFTIKPGGTVAFHGDPMSASLDLSAAYSVNANLQDLDESFANDKELNRTIVPVNAVLHLSGVMSQPDIAFDLEFPTLSQDVYRKVRSIVSTDDMMNQQIIYLLALSRFYTPEYMGNTGRNNELASVASSTISNQLSNILGQLSDKWSIAPNFHTDKGDFSDMEVELALSSRLLNNRLLLNGNFGYNDNAMNDNNFIGDFDIEYLLTKSGNFRLRAYNRYNDQNYYIRNSLTTQGVGIVFKHDFDRLFRRSKESQIVVPERASGDSAARQQIGPSLTDTSARKRKPVPRPN